MGAHARRRRRWLVVALGLGVVFALAASPGSGVTIGAVRTAAGNGTRGFSGDGAAATAAQLNFPRGVASWRGGLLIADSANNRVRFVGADGIIRTVAGTGVGGFSGDGGPATQARINSPTDVAVLPDGGFLFADNVSHRVRRVDAAGTITTVAGNGIAVYAGDGGPATAASLRWPTYLAVTKDGGFVVVDTTNRIRKVGPDGIIRTVAGTGAKGFTGDGGPATAAKISGYGGLSATSDGGFLFADPENGRIRKVGPDGIIRTVAGSVAGMGSFSGDGGPATKATLARPQDVEALSGGAFLVADTGNQRIRLVGTNGVIITVAGSGRRGDSGDGGPATEAAFDGPASVAAVTGGFVIGDPGSHRVRRVQGNLGGKPPAARPSTVVFEFRTYAHLVRDNRFQPGRSRLEGQGGVPLKPDGTVAEKALKTVLILHSDLLDRSAKPNVYTMTAQVIGGQYVTSGDADVVPQLGYRVPGPWRALALKVRVTLVEPKGSCAVGTVGRLLLLDANARLAGGRSTQTWDRVEILFPFACRGHSHGWTNADDTRMEPTRGGWPDGGHWARVKIMPLLKPATNR